MICFNYTDLSQFTEALLRRAFNEIFYQYIVPKSSTDIALEQHKLILQFLGKPDPNNTNFLVLHQCEVKIKNQKNREETIANLEIAFEKVGEIKMIQGSINEIFQSIS